MSSFLPPINKMVQVDKPKEPTGPPDQPDSARELGPIEPDVRSEAPVEKFYTYQQSYRNTSAIGRWFLLYGNPLVATV